jgi:putative two-component system response regulator
VRVLIVDDDDITTEILQNCLERFGYEVAIARNGREALELIQTGQFRLVVSDWEMPEMTGIELCRHIRQCYAAGYIYIILLTAHREIKDVREGLHAGADDFITKPFDPQELCLRVRTGERILGVETRELMIFSLAKLAESRDRETGAHLERIREYCQVIGNHLAGQEKFRREVDGEFIHLIYLTSPLHDIGKVGIPDRVLLKPGPLTPEEFEIMKQHTVIGSRTLEVAAQAHPEAKFLHIARDIARSHHEKYDGSGYPDGLAGDCIPLSGRIVALADVYDALTTKRVYKPAFSHVRARDIIVAESGSHFDPDIVLAFLDNEGRFQAIHRQFAAQSDEASLLLSPLDLAPA